MKVLFVAFLALAVGANALPREYEIETRDERSAIVEKAIRDAIDGFINLIRDNGYDPWRINKFFVENSPQPGIVIGLLIEDSELIGISNIAIHRVSYSIVTNRLQLDLSLPRVSFKIRRGRLEIDLRGSEYDAELSGDFFMTSARITIDARINVSIIGGISVRSLLCTLRIGSLSSNFKLVVNEEDYSEILNKVINIFIPQFLREHQNEIDELMAEILKYIIERILG